MKYNGKIIHNQEEADEYIFNQNPNGTDPRYLSRVSSRINHYPIRISYCSDEKTGVRFGRANIRRDKKPTKISGGGRNKGSIAAWQLWIWNI